MLNKLVLVVCALAAAPYFVSSFKVTVERTANGYLIQPKDTDETNSISPRLIGGVEVTPHRYPFQTGLLIFKGDDTYFCGGTLITNQWVLTAAHCVEMKPEVITVILGAHNLVDLSANIVQVYNTTKYKHHKEWNGKTFQNDVALIRLPKNATLNQYVKAARLATGTDKYVGKQAITLGWGKTESQELSYVLKQVTSPIISNDDCAKSNPSYKDIIKSMHICTSGVGPKGSCNGDSGGPLLVDGAQVGIVSFGTTDCTLGLPSVFTRETDFNKWITEHQTDDGFDDNGAASHSLHFVAIASVALCLVRSFGLM